MSSAQSAGVWQLAPDGTWQIAENAHDGLLLPALVHIPIHPAAAASTETSMSTIAGLQILNLSELSGKASVPLSPKAQPCEREVSEVGEGAQRDERGVGEARTARDLERDHQPLGAHGGRHADLRVLGLLRRRRGQRQWRWHRRRGRPTPCRYASSDS